MDPLQTALSQIQDIPILKDITFWHFVGAGASAYAFKKFEKHMQNTDETLKSVTEILNRVVTQSELHEYQIENHEKRLEKLENG